MHSIIADKQKDLIQLCEKYKVLFLYSFGSINTAYFRKDSDIDFLIDFDSSLTIKEYSDNYFFLLNKFKELFQRNIDLVTKNSLTNPYFIAGVNETKELIYGKNQEISL